MGAQLFDKLVQEKISPLFGDLTEPNLGLSEADLDLIKAKVNVVLHCAANVDGNESLENLVKVNCIR